MTTPNKALMFKVAAFIREHPDEFNMTSVFGRKHGGYRCGTTGCIAGIGIVLSDNKSLYEYVEACHNQGINLDDSDELIEGCSKLFGLSSYEFKTIFHSGNWPAAYRDRYQKAPTFKDQADVAADLLEDFANNKILLYPEK